MAKSTAKSKAAAKVPAKVHRSDGEVIEHLNLIATQYLRGHTIRQIVDVVNKKSKRKTSIRTVHNDIKSLLAEWKESRTMEIDDAKRVELERINNIEQTAWAGWETSLKLKSTVKKKGSGANSAGAYTSEEETSKVEETPGNPAFLRIIMDCVNKRCEILGLNSPLKIDGEGFNGAITIIQLPDNGRIGTVAQK